MFDSVPFSIASAMAVVAAAEAAVIHIDREARAVEVSVEGKAEILDQPKKAVLMVIGVDGGELVGAHVEVEIRTLGPGGWCESFPTKSAGRRGRPIGLELRLDRIDNLVDGQIEKFDEGRERLTRALQDDLDKLAESRGVELWDLSDEDYTGISEHLTPQVREVLSVEGSLNSRSSQGGTAPTAVASQLEALKVQLEPVRAYAAGA